MLGSSAIVCAVKLFCRSFELLLLDYSAYVLAYALISAFVSFALAYRLGPIENQKSLDLFQWSLQVCHRFFCAHLSSNHVFQIIGLLLVGMSSQIIHYSCFAILSLIFIKTTPIKDIKYSLFKRFVDQRVFGCILKPFSYRSDKFEFKFLTESEFEYQSDLQTKISLTELKAYCLSSECNAWQVICRLKDPIRYAEVKRWQHFVV